MRFVLAQDPERGGLPLGGEGSSGSNRGEPEGRREGSVRVLAAWDSVGRGLSGRVFLRV